MGRGLTWVGRVFGVPNPWCHRKKSQQDNHSSFRHHCQSTWVHIDMNISLMNTAQQGNNKPNSQANIGCSTALRSIEASSLPSTGACAGVAWIRSRTVRVVCRWGSDRGCGRGYEVPVMSWCIIVVFNYFLSWQFSGSFQMLGFQDPSVGNTAHWVGLQVWGNSLAPDFCSCLMIDTKFILLKGNINRAGCLLRTLGSEPGEYSIAQR